MADDAGGRQFWLEPPASLPPPPPPPPPTLPPVAQWGGPGSARQPQRTRTALVIVLSVGLPVLLIGSFVLYVRASSAAHDHMQFDDDGIRAALDRECAALYDSVDRAVPGLALPTATTASPILPSADPAEVRSLAASINTLIVNVETLGHDRLADDKPALTWLDDWAALADALDEYAQRLDRDPLASVPPMPLTSDDYPIARRVGSMHPGCAVPLAIVRHFDIAPFPRDGDGCTHSTDVAICGTARFSARPVVEGLRPSSTAIVVVRNGGNEVARARQADTTGRIDLTGIDLTIGTMVIVDGFNDLGRREVVFAA